MALIVDMDHAAQIADRELRKQFGEDANYVIFVWDEDETKYLSSVELPTAYAKLKDFIAKSSSLATGRS